MPIVHIQDNIYLIGYKRLPLEFRNINELCVREDSVLHNFDAYVQLHQEEHQKELVRLMIKSGESLEYVVDQIIKNREIKDLAKEEFYKAELARTRAMPKSKMMVNPNAKAVFAQVDNSQSMEQAMFNEGAKQAQNQFGADVDLERMLKMADSGKV